MADAPSESQPVSEEAPAVEVAHGEPSPEELRSIAQEVSSLYPPPRLGTELVLLEVNPHRAHAYWNVDVEDYQSAVAASGVESPPMLLRLYDVTGIAFDGGNAHSYFDLQVQGLQGHWYVDLWQDGRAYVAELGLRRADGGLAPLARSNPVATPPATESARYNTIALDVNRQGPAPLRLTDLISDPQLSPENVDEDTGADVELNAPPVNVVAPSTDAPYRAPDAATVEKMPAAAAFQPSAPPAVAPTKEFPMPSAVDVSPSEQVAAFFRDAEQTAASKSAHPMPRAEPVASAAVQPQSATEEKPGAQTPSEPLANWPSAEDLARHVPDTSGTAPQDVAPSREESQSESESKSPSESRRSSAPSSPPPAPATLPLDSYVSLSSYEHGRAQVELEVNVELHIYGRAKPGTQLSLYGQPVKLQPDGTFSIRKPLPHGAVVLPLLAVDPPAAPPRE